MFPLKCAIMDFEMNYKKYAPLKSLLHYITIHVKNLVLHFFSNLRYLGRHEGIFCPFSGIFVGYHWNGGPFWFFFVILKAINMYTFYLDTSHWLENPFKILGMKPLNKQLMNIWQNNSHEFIIQLSNSYNDSQFAFLYTISLKKWNSWQLNETKTFTRFFLM